MELSVLYFLPGSLLNLKNSSTIPDRELRELASNLPGLMLQGLAPNYVKSTIMLLSDGRFGRKAKAFLPFQQMQMVFVYT